MTCVEKCLAAYNHVLKILEINNDNYFKRTQILMIVAQAALFTAFGKVLAMKNPEIFEGFRLLTQRLVLVLITAFGAAFAFCWLIFIRRQCNVLALCKGYLRGIEKYLMQLGVPLGYWTYESNLSHPERRDIQPVMHFTMNPGFFTDTEEPRPLPFPLKDGDNDLPFRLRKNDVLPGAKFDLVCTIGNWLFCPRSSQRFKKFWIALTRIEQIIAFVLLLVWLSMLVMVVLPDC